MKKVELPEGANLIYSYDNNRQPNEVKYQPPATNWTEKAIRAVNNDYQSTVLLSDIKTNGMASLLSFKHSNGQVVKADYDLSGRLSVWQDGDNQTSIDEVKLNSIELQQNSSLQVDDNNLNLNDSELNLNETLVYG